ncbi:hypothetical protein SNUCP3_29540 (plasmid) [Clostridium perfringens A]
MYLFFTFSNILFELSSFILSSAFLSFVESFNSLPLLSIEFTDFNSLSNLEILELR